MPEDQTTPNQVPEPADVNTPSVEQTPASPTVSSPTSTTPSVFSAAALEQEPATVAPTPVTDNSVNPSIVPMTTLGSSFGQTPKQSSKKKWIIGGVIAAAVVILGGGGAWAYTAYQSPDKVIMDSVVNMLTSKDNGSVAAKMSFKSEQVQADLTIDGQAHDTDSKSTVSLNVQLKDESTPVKFSTGAEIVTTKTTVYFKLNNVQKAVDSAVDAYISQIVKQYESYGYTLTQSEIDAQKDAMLGQLDAFIAKIDNRWMKTDLSGKDADDKEQACVTDTVTKLQSDAKMQNELKSVYEKNRFIVVKDELGLKNGSYGYVLDLNTTKANAFGKAAMDTSFVKALNACDKSSSTSDDTEIFSSSDKPLKDTRVELWISQWAHKVSEVKISNTSGESSDSVSANFDMTMKYDNVDKIAIPSNATDIKDIQKEIENLFGSSSSVATSVI